MSNIQNKKDQTDQTPPIAVSLRDVVGEMDILSDETTAYINPKTGELFTLSEEDLSLIEDEEPPEDIPEWQQEAIPKIREVAESDDFIELPGKFGHITTDLTKTAQILIGRGYENPAGLPKPLLIRVVKLA